MNLFNEFEKEVKAVIADLSNDGKLPAAVDVTKVTVESPRDPSHGDLATNAAMVLSKQAGMNPRALAEILAEGIETIHDVKSVEIAGPGFVNIFLKQKVWQDVLHSVYAAGTDFGKSTIGKGKKVMVEFVSANPTGPLTVGHGRNAV
ncbi:MAG: arginine--tRNA ligase, partial [Alphaproteobacteria bacterium]